MSNGSVVVSLERRKQLHEELDRLLDRMPGGLEEVEAAEMVLRDGMRKLGNQTMQQWADSADRERLDTACESCGELMRHRGLKGVTVETLHGRIRFRRPRRRCERCQREVYLHDAYLRFGDHGVSWNLAKWIVRRAADSTYSTVAEHLQEDYGITLSKHTLEQIAHDAGRNVLPREDAQRRELFALPPEQLPSQLPEGSCGVDHVTVYADATKLFSNGEWRDIRVGRVMAFDEQDERLTQTTFARFLSVEEFGQRLFLEARRAGYGQARLKAFLADGAHWIWDLADLLFPDAIPILDWYHLSEKVHDCAKAVHGEGSEEAKTWAKERLDELWEGRHPQARLAVTSLRKTLRSATKREALRQLGVYLKNNQTRIDYPKYREAGLPVGSGPVESTCKRLVGQRCKLAGMRTWTDHGAESVLRFRAAKHDRDFDALWKTHVRQAA